MILNLPTPPSVNQLYATSWKTRRRFVSNKYAAWRKVADVRAVQQLCAAGFTHPFDCEVAVSIVVERPNDRRRRDVINYTKSLGDLLERVQVIVGDHLISDSRRRWGDVEGCEITVTAA